MLLVIFSTDGAHNRNSVIRSNFGDVSPDDSPRQTNNSKPRFNVYKLILQLIFEPFPMLKYYTSSHDIALRN
ncbi:hypothetical protein Bhyg_13998 [Pseudolycoriella hygida]|uniref:Uncharacterized protein n=1 Tax=Pseudolycoriella hygida TaxID=35572 RepID=A0A9Q0RX08_9DIPT|nr:hypothetical protein Bhyg_13998 [Pseudolycoriella hygida]